jgi:hypothetical protein
MPFTKAFNAGVKAICEVVWASVHDPLVLVPKFEMIDPEDEGVDPTTGKVSASFVCCLFVLTFYAAFLCCLFVLHFFAAFLVLFRSPDAALLLRV